MDVTEIRDLLANLSASARAGDVEGIMANYHPAVIKFKSYTRFLGLWESP
jgi:hypothetical protein